MDSSETSNERIAAMLQRVGNLHPAGAHIAQMDLSLAQAAVLRWVGKSPGCHIGDIAEGLGLTAPTVSVGVRRLVRKGWLECRRDVRDKRAICVYLSDKGKNLQEKMIEMQRQQINRLMGRLSSEEQTQLIDLLEKVFSDEPPEEIASADHQNEMNNEAKDE